MSVAAEPGLSPRGRRTRAALVRAAAAIFERDGFVDARITDIAGRAEVATGTFYTYFDSKEAIFREVADVLIDELYQQSHVGELAGADARARIAAANRLYVQALARHAGLYSVVIQVASIDPDFRRYRQESRRAFVQRAARGLRQLQDAGRADPDLDADLTAAMLCGMVENFAEVRHLLGEPFEEERAVEAMTDIWCRSIGLRRRSRGSS